MHLHAAKVPPLRDVGSLATWLDIDGAQLDCLADLAHRERDRSATACHYHYRLEPKPSGGWRLIEAPKPRLKAVQRQLLHRLIAAVPVHEASLGFVRGNSAVHHASRHVGQAMVISLDLRDFFPSVRASRIHATFSTLGYPPAC